jgi:hypothetical protein
MKKILSVILAMILMLGAGMFTAAADSLENDKMRTALGKMSLDVMAAKPDDEHASAVKLKIARGKMSLAILAAKPDAGIRTNSRRASGGNPRPVQGDFVLSGRDIIVEDGIYSYLFRLSPNGTLVFDNHLERKYQGIDGRYQLHYDIDEAGLHNMIVTGEFDHIITASPLLEKLSAKTRNRILSNVSDDSYFYHFVLKTEKELTFRNSLAFLYGSERHGFSFDYRYDISADKQTVKFIASDATKQAISTALENAKEYVKKLLPGKK